MSHLKIVKKLPHVIYVVDKKLLCTFSSPDTLFGFKGVETKTNSGIKDVVCGSYINFGI